MIDSENNYNKEIEGEILCRISSEYHEYIIASKTKTTYDVNSFVYKVPTNTSEPRMIICQRCGRRLYLRQNYLILYVISIPILFFLSIFSLEHYTGPFFIEILLIIQISNLLFWGYLGKKHFLFPLGLKLAEGNHWYSTSWLDHKVRNVRTKRIDR